MSSSSTWRAGVARRWPTRSAALSSDATSARKPGPAVVAAAVVLGPLMGLVNGAGIAPAVQTVGKDGAHPLALYSKTTARSARPPTPPAKAAASA